MSMFQNPDPQNLNEWLEMATKKLVFAARQRIWAEVTSHYEEAVEGHLQNGLPVALAQEAALAELGDAKAAARRFRRTHLTEWEFRRVSLLLQFPRRDWVRHTLELAGFCILCLVYYVEMVCFRSSLGRVVVVLLMVGNVVCYVLARRKSPVPTPRLIVLMASVEQLNYGIISLTAFFTIFRHVGAAKWMLAVCLLAFASSLRLFRLRNKLGKAGEEWKGESVAAWNEIPPDKPVAS